MTRTRPHDSVLFALFAGSMLPALAGCTTPISITNNQITEVITGSDCCEDDCCEDDCCEDDCCEDDCCEDDCCEDDCDDDDDGGGCDCDTGDTGDTADPDACEDFVAPDTLEFELDEACESEPDPIDFAPEVEWTWAPTDRKHDQVMMTPVVGPLTDDDGDGRVTSADPTDIAFTSFEEDYQDVGALVILDGATGAEHLYLEEFTYDGVEYQAYARGGVALGDLDDDGVPEACFTASELALACVHADGTPVFVVDLPGLSKSQAQTAYPVIGDMDGDGLAEVAVGSSIWDSTGTLLGTGSYGTASYFHSGSLWLGAAPAMADLDGDGDLELVVGNAAYQEDGTTLWDDKDGEDGPVAIGDFDGDGEPDVVTVGTGDVWLRKADGTAFPGSGASFTQTACTSGRTCGAPTVADFDGDGEPEVGIAGDDSYAVYDYDRTANTWSELWNITTYDGSNATGSSVFDFEADGVAEVIYTDEDTLFVLDGPTGASKLGLAGFDPDDFASATGVEYVSLADVDDDGSTEMVVGSNNIFEPSGSTDWTGLRVVGSGSGDPWAPSRPVWNQYAYCITNIDDDLSVPSPTAENWDTYNNFRTQDEGDRVGSWLADVFVQETSDYCVDCANGEATFYVAVANQGLADSGDFELVFDDDGTTIHQETVPSLASGEAQVIGPIVISLSDWDGYLEVLLEDADEECDEDNNVWAVGESPC